MKKQLGIIAALLTLVVGTTTLHAQPKIGDIGFGLMVGEPTGITLKGGLSGNNAWDAAIGTSWFGNLTIQADYLWNANVFNSNKAGLYFGLGGVIGIGRGKGVVVVRNEGKWYYYDDENTTALGLRGVAGFNTIPFNSPVEFFIELDPVVGLTPATGFGFMGAVGVRYYP